MLAQRSISCLLLLVSQNTHMIIIFSFQQPILHVHKYEMLDDGTWSLAYIGTASTRHQVSILCEAPSNDFFCYTTKLNSALQDEGIGILRGKWAESHNPFGIIKWHNSSNDSWWLIATKKREINKGKILIVSR